MVIASKSSFCFYYPQTYNNYKCLSPTTATLSEDSWTCSSDFFQWHSNSLFFSVLRLLRSGFLAGAKTSLSGVCFSQGRDMHMQTLKMEKTNISTVRSCSFAVHVKSCAPFPLQSNASSCSQQLQLLAPEIKATPITCQQLSPFSHPHQQVH